MTSAPHPRDRRPPGAPPPAAALRWIEECLGHDSRVVQVRALDGGTAHANHALLVTERGGREHRLVLRRWLHPDNEYSPEREIAALALLDGCEVPTPRLIAADPGGVHCGAPALLETRLPGRRPVLTGADRPELLVQLAAAALVVHGMDAGPGTLPPYVPHHAAVAAPVPGTRVVPSYARRPWVFEHAFSIAARPAGGGPDRFIHRDFAPVNTLWWEGRLTGLVDWSTAATGPAAVDIATMRLALLLDAGRQVADEFLTTFTRLRGGYPHDPYWDIRAVTDRLALGCPPRAIPVLEDYLAELVAEFSPAPDGAAPGK